MTKTVCDKCDRELLVNDRPKEDGVISASLVVVTENGDSVRAVHFCARCHRLFRAWLAMKMP